ncbi:MAG: hypothetical protein NTV62_03490 [Candidatus Gribaldobacteria bacterium]|nr:hypothetical protein [Candidatus Gribaldobacteria bacterium]
MDKTKFLDKLLKILEMVPEGISFTEDNRGGARVLLGEGQELLHISATDIQIPGISLPVNFFGKPSLLPDEFAPMDQIKELFQYLTANNLFGRLNHLGFCYAVDSAQSEKERLIDEVKKTKLHLYEEVSDDSSVWLFLGDTSNWQSPMLEFVINEKTTDPRKDYWLPHFQIDIDTYLDGNEIEKLIIDNFKGRIEPYRIIENKGMIILVRARLGVIAGINIALDMGFEGRMPRYHRTKILTQLV